MSTEYCPRAIESGGGPDSPHRAPFNGAMTWEARHGQRACSYCGSMHPDDFFAAAEAGAKLGPTDKNYKVYVDGSKKFYFQHLSDEQQQRFIDLLNARKLNIGIPGHFYVPPFFVGFAEAELGQ